MMLSRFSLLPLLAAVGAQAQYGDYGGGGSDTTTTAAAAVTTALPATTTATTTNSKCGNSGTMCVSGVVQTNGTTQYTLTVKQSQVGWMAVGFGTQMTNTPMIIMWVDPASGKAVLSQRQTAQYAMPQVAASPPRVATALQYKTSTTSSQTSLSFEIPSASGSQNMIWAYSQIAPSTPSNPGSTITQHDDQGTIQLPLGEAETGEVPLTDSQMMLRAHAIIMSLAFLLILPFGAIFVRITRTWIPGRFWFATHWIFQWPFAGLLIAIGFGLAVRVIQKDGKKHFSTTHKKWGLALVILYIVQCCLGGIIHFIKEKNRIRRPPQNYIHACLGLLIIGGSFWQVRNGYTVEWPKTQTPAVPTYANTLWVIWAILIPVLYVGGLMLLPRQYKQERAARNEHVTGIVKPTTGYA